MAKRTIEEIIEMGQNAIGDEVAKLCAPDAPQKGCMWCSKAGLLTSYTKAALAIRKDAREQSMVKNLGDIRDADLMKMIASELGIPVGRLQEFIAEARAEGGMAS